MASIRELRERWMRIYDEDVGGGVEGLKVEERREAKHCYNHNDNNIYEFDEAAARCFCVLSFLFLRMTCVRVFYERLIVTMVAFRRALPSLSQQRSTYN